MHAASRPPARAPAPPPAPAAAVSPPPPPPPSRRAALATVLSSVAAVAAASTTAGAVLAPPPARAFIDAPPGLRVHEDKLDGYYFFYPDDWLPVTTSGNDASYRSPVDVEENLFVTISSPSTSRYASVADLGPPASAAAAILAQYLTEFASTRLGVKRTGAVVSAAARTADDGREYYDVALEIKSVASRNQLAVTQAGVDAGTEVEWARVFRTVVGVAGGRRYEMRLQADAARAAGGEGATLAGIADSFRCREV